MKSYGAATMENSMEIPQKTIDFKKNLIKMGLILHSYYHSSPLKAPFSLAGSKRGSQKN